MRRGGRGGRRTGPAKPAEEAETPEAEPVIEAILADPETADEAAGLAPSDTPSAALAAAEAATVDVTFADLGLSEQMLRALTDAGYTRPTPIQAQAVPLAMKGRDLMGLAMTGTGKTAAFTIPIIERLTGGPKRTRALILTPTRELCVQVEESFRKYGRHSGLQVISVYGGVGYEPQVKALRGGVDVVVATPGRLIDHLEKQNVVFDELEVLVLDEADRMLDMGFAPQINKIVAQLDKYRQTLLFSATMPPEVEALARKYLRKPVVLQVGRRSAAATTVSHFVYPCPKEKKSALLALLMKEHKMESVLVFTRTKHGADKVVKHLAKEGIASDAMHADKTQGQRTAALAAFKKGTTKVLVATDIAQRGLDISHISHVINFDVPQQAEDYIHRIGRTGRAAKTGDAFTLMSADEIGMVRTIERMMGKPIPRVSVAGYDFGT
ncbi:MAG: DEAD/DEAH box helicase [Gemmatimonadetes bacterium]|nr:DEAD/DEAH box helicase [Gemmatimonadota bacterium]